MRSTILIFLLSGLVPAWAAIDENSDGAITAQLAHYRQVRMPFVATGLSERERKLVGKLVDATRLLDEVFWEQSDPAGLALYRSLAHSTDPAKQRLRRFLLINGGRYDLVNEFAPFGGAGPPPVSPVPADQLLKARVYVVAPATGFRVWSCTTT